MRLRLIATTLFVALSAACSSPTEGPDASTPTSIEVTPVGAVLVSIGDTIQLSATVRNGSGTGIATSVAWTSDQPGVATVDAAGRVVAVSNGDASVSARAGDITGSASVTVQQAIDSVAARGDGQATDVGTVLDSAVVVAVLDARGHPIEGVPVTFSIVSGGGALEATSGTTDVDGEVTTSWTLGTTAGLQEIEVTAGPAGELSRRISANGYPLEARTLSLFAGDAQSELALMDVPQPLQVQVTDSLGNGVPGFLVTFSVDGDAALEASEVYTDLDGVAGVGLTLGSALGAYTITADVSDTLTVDSLPLQGSPVTLQAEAVPYSVAAVADLVVGDTATLSGTGFHPDPGSNSVLLGGVTAPVLSGSQSELTIEIPDFGCTPQRGMDLEVSRDGESSTQSVTVTPFGAIDLAVGALSILDPEDGCLQFLPATDDEYLVGVTATSWFDGGATFSLVGRDTLGPFPAPSSSPGQLGDVTGLETGTGSLAIGQLAWNDSPTTRQEELALRSWEREQLPIGSVAPLLADGPSPAPPMEGDILDLRLPDLRGDPCLDYVPISAEVFSVGTRLALATSAPVLDPSNPLFGVLLNAANELQFNYGDTGVNLIMGYLGAPASWDADSRVVVVFVPEVSDMGLPAYASAVDELPRTVCPSSDEGHYIYVTIPDAATITDMATALAGAAPDLTHHIAHIVQWTRRLTSGGSLLPSWIAEGQAEVVVEHVGLTLSGQGSQNDLGSSVLSLPGLSSWIQERFDRLALFQGWDGGAGTLAGAPEECSLFGFAVVTPVCDAEASPGAAWSFVRYVADRYAPTLAGGEPALGQAIIDLDPATDPIEQLESLLGISLPELMVDWAAMLYADGRLTPAQAPALQMSSWRLDEMIPAGPQRLAPTPFGFTDFTRNGSIVGGGTAYSLVTSGGAHGALSLTVEDGAGHLLPSVLGPRIWVLRMR